MFDVHAIRRQFPILSESINGHPLVYLDSAATAQKPAAVLERLETFYRHENSNVHRAMHPLDERATAAYESARASIKNFVNARHPEEIIFTKSCTEAINLVAKSWGSHVLNENDVIVLSILEHHSNIVPWLQLKESLGIDIKWIDCDDRGHLKLDQLEEFLREGNVKLVSITGQSNVLGVRPPLQQIIPMAHAHGALVLVDAAQLIGHHQTDVQKLDCDFLAFSGHKLYGPTGIGVLYGKKDLLASMPPFLGGGQMIREVHQDRFTPADIPARFEAGTPSVADAVGLAAAIDWLSGHSWKDIEAHEQKILSAILRGLASIKETKVLGPGTAQESSGCVSFVVDGVHPHDITDILGKQGICLRAGHHCTQPLHRRLNIPASTRASVGIYTNEEDIAAFIAALPKAMTILGRG